MFPDFETPAAFRYVASSVQAVANPVRTRRTSPGVTVTVEARAAATKSSAVIA